MPEAKVCIDKKCIQTSFLLAKDITSQVILETPFLIKIYPLTEVDSKGITRTFENRDIILSFIDKPLIKTLHKIYDNISTKENQLKILKQELSILIIEEKLQNPKLQKKIKLLNNQLSLEICDDHPNAFLDRKKYIVSLPYEEGFDEGKISTKARLCHMNSEYLELCKKEIESLLKMA